MSSNLTIQHHNVDFFSDHLPTSFYFIHLLHPIPDCPWEPVTFAVTLDGRNKPMPPAVALVRESGVEFFIFFQTDSVPHVRSE